MYLIFDTETTGLPKDWTSPLSDFDNWPRMVQLAWQIHGIDGELIDVKNFIITPEGYDIPYNAEKIHGISTERALDQGKDLKEVLDIFIKDVNLSTFIIGHNVEFDKNIVGCELLRKGLKDTLSDFPSIDTKDDATDYCAIPGRRKGGYKWPSLIELHRKLFDEEFSEAHNAAADVEATSRCFLELIRIGVISFDTAGMSELQYEEYLKINPLPFKLIGLDTQPYKEIKVDSDNLNKKDQANTEENICSSFSHLHVHTQYSVLHASTNINQIIDKAVEDKMPAVAITDMYNMFGVFKFLNTVFNHEVNQNLNDGEDLRLKPIVGCELAVCEDHSNKSVKDFGFQQVFLCKNQSGYSNLSKFFLYI